MATESKLVQVGKDGITYATLPGSTAEITQEGAQLDNAIFGAEFASSYTGIIDWSFSGNAWMRNQAGYEVKLKRAGTPTAFTAAGLTRVDTTQTFTMGVDGTQHFLLDFSVTPTVYKDAVAVPASNIAEIDYLFGRVTFVDSYSVATGVFTIDGSKLPVSQFGNANSFTLTQSADTLETGSFETVQAAGGYQNYVATLLTVSLELEGFYREANDFYTILQARDDIVVEIDFAGDGESLARGVFKVTSDTQSGDVGGNETESVSLELSVPENVRPFSWYFGAATTVPTGAQTILQNWLAREDVYIRYYANGAANRGYQGQVVVTDASISAGVSDMVEITFEGQGNGGLTVLNP